MHGVSRWVAAALLTLLLLLPAAVYYYPVGGVVWNAGQVQSMGVFRMNRRFDVTSRSLIEEGLTGVRLGRIKKAVLFWRCKGFQDLEFVTASGKVSARAWCIGGFFLDYMPIR